MSVDTTARNVALDAVTAIAARLALHTGDPGAGAANEASGGGYSRQPIDWDPASGAISAMADTVSFGTIANPIQAADYTWVSLWNVAGTVRYGKAQLSPTAS